MANTNLIFSLFLIAISYMLTTTTARNPQLNGGPMVVVHILVDLPAGSPLITINCTETGGFEYREPAGSDFKYSAWRDKRSVCEIKQMGTEYRIAEVSAYEPSRDSNQDYVYWSTRNDGFYLSYDKSSWKKLYDWRVE